MHDDLATRRRVLLLTYHRYLDADRAWLIARQEVKSWFPRRNRQEPMSIGNPGSPIRRLYEQRERALLQLQAARLKLDVAKERLAIRRAKVQSPRVFLITYNSA